MPNSDITIYVNQIFLYKFLEGQDQTFKDKDLIVKTNGDISKLLRIEVNDKELDKSNYEIKSGSTILTLNKKYLSSLSNGTYRLKFVYNDGELDTTFIINNSDSNNPKTGDNILFYTLTLFISFIGIVGIGLLIRKTLKD